MAGSAIRSRAPCRWTSLGPGEGGDTADAVSEAGWEKFGEHMKRARDLLVAAWRTQPDRPEPASHMIAVAMAGHADESPRVWFDRAVAAEMDYPPAYLNLSNSLLPRWGGSPQEMVRFGLDCLRTQRFDTRVPLQLFTQVLAVENETGRTDRFWRNPQVYAKLTEMFDGYEKMPTPTDEPRHGPPLDWVEIDARRRGAEGRPVGRRPAADRQAARQAAAGGNGHDPGRTVRYRPRAGPDGQRQGPGPGRGADRWPAAGDGGLLGPLGPSSPRPRRRTPIPEPGRISRPGWDSFAKRGPSWPVSGPSCPSMRR